MKLKDIFLAPFDLFYKAVCGDLDCTYCTFYRGVVVGVAIGVLLVRLTAA